MGATEHRTARKASILAKAARHVSADWPTGSFWHRTLWLRYLSHTDRHAVTQMRNSPPLNWPGTGVQNWGL